MTAYVNQSFELSEVSAIENQAYEPTDALEIATGGTMEEVDLGIEESECSENEIDQNDSKVHVTIGEPTVQNSSIEVPVKGAITCVPEHCNEVKDTILQMVETEQVFDPHLKIKLWVFYSLVMSLIVWAIFQFGVM